MTNGTIDAYEAGVFFLQRYSSQQHCCAFGNLFLLLSSSTYICMALSCHLGFGLCNARKTKIPFWCSKAGSSAEFAVEKKRLIMHKNFPILQCRIDRLIPTGWIDSAAAMDEAPRRSAAAQATALKRCLRKLRARAKEGEGYGREVASSLTRAPSSTTAPIAEGTLQRRAYVQLHTQRVEVIQAHRPEGAVRKILAGICRHIPLPQRPGAEPRSGHVILRRGQSSRRNNILTQDTFNGRTVSGLSIYNALDDDIVVNLSSDEHFFLQRVTGAASR
ncbi:hypothetical protein BU23DRAFT_311792 [Bimuria novae-zelandiae CBS 107.79]|uniref:Uncharacterized protein n=1 Tax=Bimuria novae-zelandiae CBS 107.79 TaxID=1447943 RepID=A0A6A5UV46_9PLEO|nr:hypothetical protein BU23DRAFT_311792 [Bimuria novae-zelandiae CBS 107.79]